MLEKAKVTISQNFQIFSEVSPNPQIFTEFQFITDAPNTTNGPFLSLHRPALKQISLPPNLTLYPDASVQPDDENGNSLMKTAEETFHDIDADPLFIPYRPPQAVSPFHEEKRSQANVVRKESADGVKVQMTVLSPSRLRYTSTWHSSRPRPRLTVETEEETRPVSADYTPISRRHSPPPVSTGSTEEASLAWGRQRPAPSRQRTLSSEQSIDEEDGTDRESNVHRPLLRNESTGTETFDSPISDKNSASNPL